MLIIQPVQEVKRTAPTIIDRNLEIFRWDSDNLYPQRMRELVKRSHTLNGVLNRIADFLAGEGFEDDALAKLIVNNDTFIGTTGDKLVEEITAQFARYKSFALHINYNLNYHISEMRIADIDYLRFGFPDPSGNISTLKYCTNWELQYNKQMGSVYIYDYDIFNPNPEVIASQIERDGGINNYKGQILWITPEIEKYPLATFHAVTDAAYAQGELGTFKRTQIDENFTTNFAVIYPGEFETKEEEDKFKALVSNHKGARGKRIIGIQDKSGLRKANELFMPLSPVNTDRLFEATETSVLNAIMENEAMPKELLGVRPESGMFNQDNMQQAYIYYNTCTRKRRMLISQLLSKLFTFWNTPITSTANIIPLKYGDSINEQAAASNGELPTGQQKPTPTADELAANEVLRKLSRSELSKFYGYINDFKKGRATRDQTLIFLRAYGLSDEAIDLFLNDNPDDDPKP